MKISIQHLTKVFPSREKKGKPVVAVNDMSIEIPSGKLVGLLGPSGCGKSTTLFMLSGLESPTQGNIFFDEQDVTTLAPERRGIGLVFQNYALYPHMTVAQNIMFPLLNMRIPKEQAKEIVDFFYKVKDDTDWFVINCYAGMSRSAGCCAAIMRMMYNEDSPVFNNGFFTPNMKVYRMILNAWLDRIAEDAEKQNTVAWRNENEEILEDNTNDCDY